ncbi:MULTISPECIES: flagellar assembly peptidoglycan hydrolase FlgJ [unclassified Photobacterium]|uniref:flagellar assembly peptidoglycan hydrolase FlgJ n=1 Tax=unclassified Photobacterium TaxID=2628852 RepID=UPI001EDCE58F|nr:MULTISPECIES: flagellar assembly peptidoglycan hydrolase FlgJ [unclassified Photobacterium]MCG3862490.1 flagellar assembly peptidoglycan hydrolase FlgJ [Photobacterium sp. Ph6]MCG3874011.1 flagellar assembly peptidoglycan hydrolase FlgJ [Photobacterium sp. Ph5]
MKQIDPGFVHDISNLDRLRAGIGEDSKGSLRQAANQFESIFTQMLFKSMREANEAFESDLMSSNNSKFYQQMHDEQMSSQLSTTGSLGLADMIVKQLGGEGNEQKPHTPTTDLFPKKDNTDPLQIRPIDNKSQPLKLPQREDQNSVAAQQVLEKYKQRLHTADVQPPLRQPEPDRFETPEAFVDHMAPYATKAARALGTDPAMLIAQAALETGWGKKVIKNAAGTSNNLFNIKADPRWSGQKVATRTLEYHNGVAVQENAAFRSYGSYQDSFQDFVKFLQQNPRYSTALKHSGEPNQFIREIHKAGYATDPNYSNKVLAVMKKVKTLM